MKRTKPLKADPEKARAFQRRGAERYEERVRERGRRPLERRDSLPSRWVRICEACGDEFIDRRRPARQRKTCSTECRNELVRRGKLGDANPMRRRETAARVAARRVGRRAVLDIDLPGEVASECARPTCNRPLPYGAKVYCSAACHYADRGRRGSRRRQAYHRCRACGEVFAWNGRGRGVFCTLDCARSNGPRVLSPDVVDVVQLRGHRRSDWNAVDLARCCRPGCSRRAVNRHHVIFEQHVMRAGGDRWDPRNAIGLCFRCHMDLHAKLDFPVSALPAGALEFAAELLGAAAADYLRRRYAGSDERLSRLERDYPEGRRS